MMNTPSALLLTVFVSLLFHGVEPSKYLGCFIDKGERLLNGTSNSLESSLTVEICVDFCTKKGFRFAGVEYKSECYCGNTQPSALASTKEEDCNMPCAGNTKQSCGGSWRIGVYDSIDLNPRNYLGCFADSSDRILRGTKKNFPDTLTVEVCVDYCRRNGFKYAGVEFKMECYCSHSAPSSSVQAAEGSCNTPCIGNEKQTCGGSWHINVYDTKDYNSKNFLGCYTDKPERILPGKKIDFPKTLTIELCLSHCKRNGFRYAGVENKVECHCANALPSIVQLSSEDSCDEPCEGNSKQTCGGFWHLNLYDTKGLRLSKYLGCYVDKGKKLLPELKSVFDKTLTVEVCQDHCLSKGFTFSGVEGRVECYCSNNRPTNKQLAHEASCDLPCDGNKSQICGGFYRANVYEALKIF